MYFLFEKISEFCSSSSRAPAILNPEIPGRSDFKMILWGRYSRAGESTETLKFMNMLRMKGSLAYDAIIDLRIAKMYRASTYKMILRTDLRG
jgi:hypothetical protein